MLFLILDRYYKEIQIWYTYFHAKLFHIKGSSVQKDAELKSTLRN